MNTQALRRTTALGAAMAVTFFFVSSVASARIITPPLSEFWLIAAATPAVPLEPLPLAPLEPPAAVPPDPPPVAPPTPQPQKKEAAPASVPPAPGATESTRPLPKPAPAESRTPEEASARAADPKDPSGALIVKPPLGSDAPAKTR